MEIALIVAGGLVLLTAVAGFFDYLGKRRSGIDTETKARIEALEKRLGELEAATATDASRLARLEGDLSFMNRLVEGRGEGGRIPDKTP